MTEEQNPTNYYFDEDIANDKNAQNQLSLYDRTGRLNPFDSNKIYNNDEKWLQNKSEEFYNGMHAGIRAALWFIENYPTDAHAYLLGLRCDLLKVYHKKSFKSTDNEQEKDTNAQITRDTDTKETDTGV